ncbi:MAG TPA: CvpA family protein, partial [Chitinophagaceae bacterium]|nr:CvpA family protein [Chitinophagaceae bacterium]
MNLIDFFLLAVILLAMWGGYRRGFILGALNLLTWLVSLFFAFMCYGFVAGWLETYWPSLGAWTQPLAFLGTLFLLLTILSFLFGRIAAALGADVHTHGINRFLGLAPGFVKGLVYAVVFSALLLSLPLSDRLSATMRESSMASVFAVGADWMNEKLAPVFNDAISRTMNKMTVKPDSDETVNLRFKVTDPKVRADLEAQMLDLVNEERRKAGLPPVKADPEMQVV